MLIILKNEFGKNVLAISALKSNWQCPVFIEKNFNLYKC